MVWLTNVCPAYYVLFFFFFNDTATTEIYTLSLHDALPILGIVGESGSGKSVTCRTIVGLMPSGMTHISGEVIYHPHGDQSILTARQSELQALRGSQLAMIFQDPMTALNPVVNVGAQVIEAV